MYLNRKLKVNFLTKTLNTMHKKKQIGLKDTVNNITVSMDMVCNLVLYPHGSSKLHSHYSFAIAIDDQHSCHHIRARKIKIVLCKHVSNYVTL
jgi:hypothetical protein